MTIKLSILNHLGFNLYSNVPPVLSEVVADDLWMRKLKEV